MTEEWQPQDSGKIQLASLTKFMQVLGYSYMIPTHSFESGLWVTVDDSMCHSIQP